MGFTLFPVKLGLYHAADEKSMIGFGIEQTEKLPKTAKKPGRPGIFPVLPGPQNAAIVFDGYSLTPPRATPAMMYLLKAKYTMISGRAVRVRPR